MLLERTASTIQTTYFLLARQEVVKIFHLSASEVSKNQTLHLLLTTPAINLPDCSRTTLTGLLAQVHGVSEADEYVAAATTGGRVIIVVTH